MHSDKATENKQERAQEMDDVCRGLRAGLEGQELESYLRQQQRLATLGLLISGIAHEVNNPLTTVMNYAQSIVESAPAGSPARSSPAEPKAGGDCGQHSAEPACGLVPEPGDSTGADKSADKLVRCGCCAVSVARFKKDGLSQPAGGFG